MTSLHRLVSHFVLNLIRKIYSSYSVSFDFFYIRIKQPIVFKLEFFKSPSYKDDSDKSCSLNLKIHPSFAKIAIHLFVIYINTTFNGKPGFILFLDNLEQTVASSLERNKSKSFKDIVKNFWKF